MVNGVIWVALMVVVGRGVMVHVLSSGSAGLMTQLRFAQLMLAGGLCAFVSHALFTPIDVVKTRIQVTVGKYDGVMDAVRCIIREEGGSALLKGLGATSAGYFVHGAFKFAFYELFKLYFSATLEEALRPPLYIAALSGLCAELIAGTFLCPMEAVRIRSVVDPAFPNNPFAGIRVLYKAEGMQGLFKGLPPILLKQVPYTIGQFAAFEISVKVVRSVFSFLLGPASQFPVWSLSLISLFAGGLAGLIAAVVSQPGDTILTKINQQEGEGSAISQIVRYGKALWFGGLFLGLGTRLLHVGCMVACQFLIYDSVKILCGIETAAAQLTKLEPQIQEPVIGTLSLDSNTSAAIGLTKDLFDALNTSKS